MSPLSAWRERYAGRRRCQWAATVIRHVGGRGVTPAPPRWVGAVVGRRRRKPSQLQEDRIAGELGPAFVRIAAICGQQVRGAAARYGAAPASGHSLAGRPEQRGRSGYRWHRPADNPLAAGVRRSSAFARSSSIWRLLVLRKAVVLETAPQVVLGARRARRGRFVGLLLLDGGRLTAAGRRCRAIRRAPGSSGPTACSSAPSSAAWPRRRAGA
jgi:hypothetical protein